MICIFFFFQAEDGIRDAQESRGLGDVYKRQGISDISVSLLAKSLRANYSLLSVIVAANPSITTRPRQDLEEAVTLNRFPTKVKDMIPVLSANVQGITSVDCLLYTSDAADEEDSVDLGGCRILKKKKTKQMKSEHK
eukprot:TRINITY_DN28147_c0_g1_i1.p1 TRINITY_DN28147_c0_g1~~TRINITY_DN28147_c0_g1_i1.p1  ORF type:complete len:137 (-),score=39.61 TRINITY_DN28147_c0_g1_i1:21-431(-)